MSNFPLGCVLSDISFGKLGGIQLYSACHSPRADCPKPTSGPGSMHIATAPVINMQAHYRPPEKTSPQKSETPDLRNLKDIGLRKRGEF